MASDDPGLPIDPTDAAKMLASALDERRIAYAIGGALACGYWGMPRGTLDVDLTLYVSPEDPAAALRLLHEIGCAADDKRALDTLAEHGFCTATLRGIRIDVFLPIVGFYAIAHDRRRIVDLEGVPVAIWDAETMCIFKLMFFRDKDLVDVGQIIRTQGDLLDADWITAQAESLFGRRDPRVARWCELRTA